MVQCGFTILVSGPPGAGKTTLLTELLGEVSPRERIITVEKNLLELRLEDDPRHPDAPALFTRSANAEGEGEITTRQLVELTRRLNPDRVVVGELVEDEALDMLDVASMCKRGSLATIHAHTSDVVLQRLAYYVAKSNTKLPEFAVWSLIAQTVDFVIHIDLVRNVVERRRARAPCDVDHRDRRARRARWAGGDRGLGDRRRGNADAAGAAVGASPPAAASRRLRPAAVRTGGGLVSAIRRARRARRSLFVLGVVLVATPPAPACRHDAAIPLAEAPGRSARGRAHRRHAPCCSCRAGCCPPRSWAVLRSGRPPVGWAADVAMSREIERLDALASWIESVRDVLMAGEQPVGAITSTVAACPPVIRPHVRRLALGLARQDPDHVFRRFADELDDPLADLVATGLSIAVRRGARTVPVLTALAEQTRQQVDRRRLVEAERAPTRREVQALTAIMGALVLGLLLLGRSDYLTAYDTATGSDVPRRRAHRLRGVDPSCPAPRRLPAPRPLPHQRSGAQFADEQVIVR